MNAQLRDLINAVLPDLEHYAATHGPGPDQRLKDLKEALKAWDTEALASWKLQNNIP